jgi:hypothetical protein
MLFYIPIQSASPRISFGASPHGAVAGAVAVSVTVFILDDGPTGKTVPAERSTFGEKTSKSFARSHETTRIRLQFRPDPDNFKTFPRA